MDIKKLIWKWGDHSLFIFRLLNKYSRYKQAKMAMKDPREVANITYKSVFGKDINWEHPTNLIEKIYWLQLYTDTSLWSVCADKYRIREYAVQKGIIDLLPKLYGRWENPKDIDFDKLPKSFVLKTTNGCGQVLLVRDKVKLNIRQTRNLLERWMMFRYGFESAQIHYTRIQPCIIAEEYLTDSDDDEKGITDYKVWCLGGKVAYILCVYDRVILGENHGYHLSAYDPDWNDISSQCLKANKQGGRKVDKPRFLNQMIGYAEQIAEDFQEVRVDFYETSDRIYLGELTFTTGYGYHKDSFYEYLGSKIDLSKVKRIDGINRPDMAKLKL